MHALSDYLPILGANGSARDCFTKLLCKAYGLGFEIDYEIVPSDVVTLLAHVNADTL